jgi:hypothetical protein
MGLRQHLVDHHTDQADHHIRRGKECAKAAASHDVMAKSVSLGADAKKHHEEMRDCYKAMAGEHTRMAELHVRKCREASTMDLDEEHRKVTKIASDADRFARDTDGVAGVHGPDLSRVTLAPRFGVDAGEIERANRESNLAKLPAFQRREVTS